MSTSATSRLQRAIEAAVERPWPHRIHAFADALLSKVLPDQPVYRHFDGLVFSEIRKLLPNARIAAPITNGLAVGHADGVDGLIQHFRC